MAIELRRRENDAVGSLLEILSLPFRPELREHFHFCHLLEVASGNRDAREREQAVRQVTLVAEDLERVIESNREERTARHQRVELYLAREYPALVQQVCDSVQRDSDWRVRSACVTAINILLGGNRRVAAAQRRELLEAICAAQECEAHPAVKLELQQSCAFWKRRQRALY